MAKIVIYDAADATVPNKVTGYLPSANTPDYTARVGTDVLVNPDEAGTTLSTNQWVAVPGSNSVRDMTQQEIDDIAAADATAFEAAVRAGAKAYKQAFDERGLYLRAFADIVKDEINIIRGWTVDYKAEVAAATSLGDLQTRVAGMATLADRTLSQLKTQIDDRIDSGDVDGD